MDYWGNTDGERRRRRRRRRWPHALVAALVIVIPLGPEPAGAVTFDAGVCTLRLDVSSGAAVPRVPAAGTWTVNGSGTCHTTTGLHQSATISGNLSGPLGHATVGCASAVLAGSLNFSIGETITLTTTGALVVGAAVVLVGVRTPDVAVAGTFVQDVANSAACVVGGEIDQATWCGVLLYGDPAV